ncbi:hypothetical protein A0H81_07617 [Grifola frondosa]|uniref:Uncharacterized protein n=1 Tax=Grifola frondosa TaxID=5627 RepID=A0A1C7MB40_GRIFR|nr:hypothetical protein A0H81_07617 [Grifola frondosa]
MQPPRFLSLYRRLFGGGAGYWASAPHADLRMDALTGCPDEAILAVAEISALAHWKATELHGGSLSVRELIRRGDQIEQQLRQRSGVRQFDDRERASLEPGLSSTPPVNQAGGIPLPRGAVVFGASWHGCAAVLYLHTVLSESIPGVPEIVASVEQISSLLNKLPPSEFDRALVFPLFLTGCMTDNAMLRELVKHRFLLQDAAVGNVLLARTLMENVWARRASAYAQRPGGIVVDWRSTSEITGGACCSSKMTQFMSAVCDYRVCYRAESPPTHLCFRIALFTRLFRYSFSLS